MPNQVKKQEFTAETQRSRRNPGEYQFSLAIALRVCGPGIVPILLCVILWGLLIPVDSAHAKGKALLIGIENYPSKPLLGVRDDVRLMKEAILKQNLFTDAEIRTLLDRQATRASIVEGIKQWLIEGTHPGDTILFYFSGHGIRMWDEIGDSEDGFAQALVCYDARILGPKERRLFRGVQYTAVSPRKTKNFLMDHEIHALLKKMTGRKVIFICDSCFSGTVYKTFDPFFVQIKTLDEPEGDESVFDERLPEPVIPKAARRNIGVAGNPVIPGVDLAAMLSSLDSEPSQVRNFNKEPTGRHSVFTWFLYHGLRGAAAVNNEGVVTLGSLAKFVQDGMKKAQMPQTPQHVFSPESLASQPLIAARPTSPAAAQPSATQPAQPRRPTADVTKPSLMGCKLDVHNVPQHEVERLKAELVRRVPPIVWTDDSKLVSCRILVEKKGATYGARLSDRSGTYWEANTGDKLDAVFQPLAGNLRAYFAQLNFAALHVAQNKLRCEVSYGLQSPHPRNDSQAVQGDAIVFKATATTPGYFYILNVDARGVIHPLFPLANEKPRALKQGETVELGSDGSIKCTEPFGKETFVALFFAEPPAALSAFWAKDHIGGAQALTFDDQQGFLDTVWSELISQGKPKTAWAQELWVLQSFRE